MRIKLLDCQDAILEKKAKEENNNGVGELDVPVNIIE